MAVLETLGAHYTTKLYLSSGQFTTTVRDSLDTSAVLSHGISWDGANTLWVNFTNDKLMLTSGKFTSTIKTSQSVAAIDNAPISIGSDPDNTPWNGVEATKLYLQSGQFTATVKTSRVQSYPHDGDAIRLEAEPDSLHSVWVEYVSPADTLYYESGQFSGTIRSSLGVGAIEAAPRSVSHDGVNSPWCGDESGPKYYLQSGLFTATLKTSESAPNTKPMGISHDDYAGRIFTAEEPEPEPEPEPTGAPPAPKTTVRTPERKYPRMLSIGDRRILVRSWSEEKAMIAAYQSRRKRVAEKKEDFKEQKAQTPRIQTWEEAKAKERKDQPIKLTSWQTLGDAKVKARKEQPIQTPGMQTLGDATTKDLEARRLQTKIINSALFKRTRR